MAGVGAIGTDITDRKITNQALRSSEARFKGFAEVASDWFWEMGPDLLFTYFSPRYAEITGFPIEKRLGKSRNEFIPTDLSEIEAEKLAAHFADLEARRAFKDFDYITMATGKERYVRISGVPVFDEDGEFLGYRGTGIDITERKQAVQALKNSEARFKDFAEIASDWFWEMDENLRFSYFSEQLRSYWLQDGRFDRQKPARCHS